MKGYRLVGLLASDVPIPDETGSRRHFSDTLARTRWWEKRSHLEAGTGWLPQMENALQYGYAVVQIEAEDVEEDGKSLPSSDGKDWIGRITSVQPLRVVRYPYPKFPFPQKTFWGKVKCFFGIHLPCRGKDEYDFTTGIVVKDRKCWICDKQIRQESNFLKEEL